ncbi:MAG: AI-2E family transporter [Acutalibacteraceae bacterium]|jgi:predicted PurR-regulated permease PerM
MKPEEKPSRRAFSAPVRKGLIAFAVLAAAILFAFLLFRLSGVFQFFKILLDAVRPIIYGLAIAYLLNPVMNACQKRLTPFFTKRMKKKSRAEGLAKGLSILAAVLVAVAVLVLLCLLIIPQLSRSILGLVDKAPGYFDSFMERVNHLLNSQSEWSKTLRSLMQEAINHLEKWVSTSLGSFATEMLNYVTSGIISVVNGVINLFVGMVVAVYTLGEKRTFLGQSKKLLYAFLKPRRANALIDTVRRAHTIFGGFIYAKILDSILVGVLTFIGLSIMRTPYALLVSVLIGVTNIIPFFGPFIGAIPSAFLILLVDPWQSLYFIIFIVVLQQIDGNVISPKILGNKTGLTQFWVLFSLMFFGGVFGVTGMIIGVPTFAVIYFLLQNWLQKRMQKRKMPVSSRLYADAERMDEQTNQLEYPET